MHRVNKRIFIIAGPNGAGKTTFARSFLPAEAQCQTFINADLIAAGLSPFAPEVAAIKAGKIMIKEIMAHSECGVSFAFETTLAGIGYRKHIRRWRFQGYHISLFFLALPNIEIAITRVAERVKQGGHNIPEQVIRRRFVSSLRNFEEIYKHEVHSWVKIDNAGHNPQILSWGENLL